jgi:hypothetical protein
MFRIISGERTTDAHLSCPHKGKEVDRKKGREEREECEIRVTKSLPNPNTMIIIPRKKEKLENVMKKYLNEKNIKKLKFLLQKKLRKKKKIVKKIKKIEKKKCGDAGFRSRCLLNANQTRYQFRHIPNKSIRIHNKF